MHKLDNLKGLPLYIETIEKEKLLRVRWFNQNLDRVKRISKIKETSEDYSETASLLNKCKNNLKHLNDGNRPIIEAKINIPEVIKDDSAYSPMRPVPQEVKDLLYSSNCKEGTDKYLKERWKEGPEDKYYYPECTNWQYGWGARRSMLHVMPRKGKTAFFRSDLYRKSGVGPDPPHYRKPSMNKKSICQV